MIDIVDFLQALGVQAPVIQVTDVGALRLGQESWDDLIDRGAARLLGFEPQMAGETSAPPAAEAAPPRRFLPDAVGDGEVWPFHRCAFPATSSMFEPDLAFVSQFNGLERLMQVLETTTLPTRRLDDIPEAQTTDLLKLDVQGFELKILENATGTLDHALVVQTEVSFVPLYKRQPLFAEVDTLLRDRGFMLHTFLGFGQRCFKPLVVNDDELAGLRQTLWSDAVYVKLAAPMAPPALLKQAVISHAIYGSYDLTARALLAYDQATSSGLLHRYVQALTIRQAA
jgi:FkbM family methyltransferase